MKKQNTRKWLIISSAVAVVIVIACLVYFLGVRKTGTVFHSYNYSTIPSIALTSSQVQSKLTGLTLDPSLSDYQYYPYANTSVGFINGHSGVYYYNNGSSYSPFGFVASYIYNYSSPAFANSSFERNRQKFVNAGCSELYQGYTNGTNLFVCEVFANYTNYTNYHLDSILMSRSNYVGLVMMGESGMPKSSLLNQTFNYSRVIGSKIDYLVNSQNVTA